MNHTTIQIWIIIFGVFVIASPWILVEFIGDETHIEIVECYDRFGNEIIGLTCEEDVFDNPHIGTIYLVGIFTMIIGFGMILVSGISLLQPEEE